MTTPFPRILLYAALVAGLVSVAAPVGRAQPSPGKPWLGVILDTDGKPGIPIKRVYPGSPAEAAGIKAGDRIFRVAGGAVPDVGAMQQAVAAHRPGQRVEVKLTRQGRPMTFRVLLQPMPTYEDRVKSHLLGKAAPPFSATRVDARGAAGAVTTRSLRGKVVLVEFWASWCGACRRAVPLLKRLHQQMGPRGLEIVSIARDAVSTASALRSGLQIPYTVLADPMGRAMRDYWINPIPAFVLLDRRGVVRGVAVGSTWGQDLMKMLRLADQLLAKGGPRGAARPLPGRPRPLPGRPSPAPARPRPEPF